ncbi:hypothetical protein A9320_01390 [Ruegeria sp. PBVC088]|nr:hypothetical protein A9320_01390 [Ruegeria sp. PBVC088]
MTDHSRFSGHDRSDFVRIDQNGSEPQVFRKYFDARQRTVKDKLDDICDGFPDDFRCGNGVHHAITALAHRLGRTTKSEKKIVKIVFGDLRR